jgi:hypothetical protein
MLDLSSLTDELATIWQSYHRKGWEFVFRLRDGLDELREELGPQYRQGEIVGQIAEALDIRAHTLQNKLILARKPWSGLAFELGLDIGHGDAVSGLEDEAAEDMLHRAAEQRWTVSELRREVYMSRQIEEVQSWEVLTDQIAEGLAGEDPPYCSNAMYQDVPLGVRPYDYSRQPLEEMIAKVKNMLPPFQRPALEKLLVMVRADERERVG